MSVTSEVVGKSQCSINWVSSTRKRTSGRSSQKSEIVYLYLFQWQCRNELNNNGESKEQNKARKEELTWAGCKRLKEI